MRLLSACAAAVSWAWIDPAISGSGSARQVLLPGTRGTVRMHRSEFENRIGAQIGQTVAALGRAVASAGLTPQGLTAVLLVGGSSRIPLVSQMVSEQFDRPGMRERVIREMAEIYKGNLYFGEDLMEIPIDGPRAVRLD